MELTTLLNKTKVSVSNLTIYEHRFLSFLLARVNGKKVPFVGYLAWPGIEEIQDYTGISSTQIARIRKSLVQSGWMKYIPGKGPRNSNHYYIDAQKIIDSVVNSGENMPKLPPAPTVMEDKVKAPHKRNTDNLAQNKDKPNEYVKPAQQKHAQQIPVDKPVSKPIIAQDDEDPFSGYVAPKKVESVKGPGKNPDGSDPFFLNGQRRYSHNDVMDPYYDDPDCPF